MRITLIMRIPNIGILLKAFLTLSWSHTVSSTSSLRGQAHNFQEEDCTFCTYHEMIGACFAPAEQLLLQETEEGREITPLEDALLILGWDCSVALQQKQRENEKNIPIHIISSNDEEDIVSTRDDDNDFNGKDNEKYKNNRAIDKSLTDCLLSGSNEKDCQTNSNSECVWCAEPIAGLCVTPKVARNIGKLPMFKCKTIDDEDDDEKMIETQNFAIDKES
eukprot:CAMPEP_0195285528 /NCGR_PEP_ID=MMETSP0707-20130614/3327_1 /TAXON_ID=33640 /ORGANISM="Asterionellopsis glacialis, Strain CCMP134" /LENGTH=219 /DNA_ID=CAMNT_0040345031 /DNA_START=26 /DNA_END=685 /DNA_ORIENTATION=-